MCTGTTELQLAGVSVANQTVFAQVRAQPFSLRDYEVQNTPVENGAMRLHNSTSDTSCTQDDDDGDAEGDDDDADDGDDDDIDDDGE